MEGLLGFLFVLLMVGCVLGLILQFSFLGRLRTRHPQAWEALGCPSLFLNNSIGNSVAVLRFIWTRDYRALGDEQFVRFADFLRMYYAAYAILFALVVAVFITNIVPR